MTSNARDSEHVIRKRDDYETHLEALRSAREWAYVEAFVETMKRMESAIRAGYSRSGASGAAKKLHDLPRVQRAIDAGLALKAAMVAERIVPVDAGVIDKEMERIALDQGVDPSVRVKAAVAWYRRRGLFAPRAKAQPQGAASAPRRFQVEVVGEVEGVEWVEDGKGNMLPQLVEGADS